MSKLLLYVEIRFHLTKTQMRAILFAFMLLFLMIRRFKGPVYGLIITVNIVIDLLEAKPSVSTLVLIRSEISLSLNPKGTLICGQYRNYL